MTKLRVKLPALLLLCLLALLLCGSAMAAEAVTYVGQDGNDATCGAGAECSLSVFM